MEASENMRRLLAIGLLAIGILPVRVIAQDTSDANDVALRTSRYVFDADRSTILQSGGFAGVHWTYAVEGQFCLIVDEEAGAAWFEQVETNAVDETEPPRVLDPNEVFNLEDLTGTIVDETTVEFAGQADDGSKIGLTLTVTDDTAWLAGETTPPPNSADFFVFSLDAVATRKYAGGTGEPNTPYLIATAEQMNAIGTAPNDWDKHFRLTADIDLSPYDGQDGRPAFNIIAPSQWDFQRTPFTGVFDGNGCTIANFRWSDATGIDIGLFGHVSDPNAEIKNLSLTDPNMYVSGAFCVGALIGYLEQGTVHNCSVKKGSITGIETVGGLIGEVYGDCVITDCHVTATVSGWRNIGGLVGSNTGTITRCHADCTVTGDESIGGLVGWNNVVRVGRVPTTQAISTGSVRYCRASGNISGNRDVGGLIGGLYDGSISDSYATASVNGNIEIGGLAGGSNGTITNCYAIGTVSGQSCVGGLIGILGWAFDGLVGSLWDIETTGQVTSAAGTGLTTAEMQTAAPFLEAEWDFVGETDNGVEDIWWIDEGRDYPRLWWERDEASL